MRANNRVVNNDPHATTTEIVLVEEPTNINASTPVRQTTFRPINQNQLQQLLFSHRSRSLPNVSQPSQGLTRDRVAELLATETLTAERTALITENRAIVNELLSNGMRRNELINYDMTVLRNIIAESIRVAEADAFDTFISLGGR